MLGLYRWPSLTKGFRLGTPVDSKIDGYLNHGSGPPSLSERNQSWSALEGFLRHARMMASQFLSVAKKVGSVGHYNAHSEQKSYFRFLEETEVTFLCPNKVI